MLDHRVRRLAELLIRHCISVERNDRVLIQSRVVAEPLVLPLAEEVLRAGGHPHLLVYPDRYDELFERFAQDHQLAFAPTFELLAYQQFEARVWVRTEVNTREFTHVDPHRESLSSSAWEPVWKAQFDREGNGQFKRVTTLFPTQAYAQDARMSLSEFEDFFYGACHVNDNQADPVAFWAGMARDNEARIRAISGHNSIHLKSDNCDLKFSIDGRKFLTAAGRVNMPDGEIYTGPVEDSVNGWIHFTYPSIVSGTEVAGIELTFADGAVTKAIARVGEPTLKARLATDEGASRVGEFGIGTNYGIAQASGMGLMDEKLGGSIHLALGLGYPETGNTNKSAIHWDLLTDFSKDAEMAFDGEVVFKDGKFIV
jgi:aminopeptidase